MNSGAAVRIDSAAQRMEVYLDGRLVKRYVISTGKAGMGCEAGSGKTPTGRHKIARMFGHGAKPGQVFVSRRAVKGQTFDPEQWRSSCGKDAILTRIIWLDGLEDGVNRGGNCDTKKRYIYIHGTNQEQLLGTPASHGCIRMSNRDILEFFAFAKRNRSMEIVIV